MPLLEQSLDRIFGTAFMPGWWPAGYWVQEEIPQSGYVQQLTFPLRSSHAAVAPALRPHD